MRGRLSAASSFAEVCRQRGTRHAGISWISERIPHENDATRLVNGANAERSVRAGAAKYHGQGVAVCGGDRAEEPVNRRPFVARLSKGFWHETAAFDHQFAVRGDDVNAVRAQLKGVLHLLDGHLRALGENSAELARMVGCEVDHHHISQPDIIVDRAKEI